MKQNDDNNNALPTASPAGPHINLIPLELQDPRLHREQDRDNPKIESSPFELQAVEHAASHPDADPICHECGESFAKSKWNYRFCPECRSEYGQKRKLDLVNRVMSLPFDDLVAIGYFLFEHSWVKTFLDGTHEASNGRKMSIYALLKYVRLHENTVYKALTRQQAIESGKSRKNTKKQKQKRLSKAARSKIVSEAMKSHFAEHNDEQVMKIIEAIATSPNSAANATTLVAKTGLTKSTLYRYLGQIVKSGKIVRRGMKYAMPYDAGFIDPYGNLPKIR